MSRLSIQGLAPLLAGLVLLLIAAAARADQIRIGGIPYPGVRITNIVSGTVEYIAAGQRRTKPLAEVDALRFDRYPAYHEAMALIERDPSTAAAQLRELLNRIRDGESWLKPLVRLRLSEALDAAGRFREALEAYLEAVEADDSRYFVTRAPANFPTDAEAAQTAAAAVRQALERTRDSDVREQLERTLAAIRAEAPGAAPTAAAPTEPAPTEPRDRATDPSPEAPPASEEPPTRSGGDDGDGGDADGAAGAVAVSAIQRHMADGDYAAAVEQADELIARWNREGDTRLLPDALYQRARAYAAMGKATSAALSYLRIVIHFEDHGLAGPALIEAGRMLEQAGRTDAAIRVYRHGAATFDDPTIQRQCREALARLS